MPLQYCRYYNSLANESTAFGPKWRGSYDRRLAVASGEIIAWREDGSRLVFTWSGSDWVTDADVHRRLETIASGFQFVDEGDILEVYDSNGKLTSISTRDGKTQTLSYIGAGQLTSVTDPAGRALSFAYDGNGRVASLVDPAGEVTLYEYNASGVLQSVIFPDNTPGSTTDNLRREYHDEDVNFPQ